jgi:hypothetical protein
MTKEDWEKVKKALSGTYGYARLKVDGRDIQFQRELVSKNTLGIHVYIDGHSKGIWWGVKNEHPEQSYLRPVNKNIYSSKQREQFKKISKRLKLHLGINPNEKLLLFYPLWNNVDQIRRHYEKTFTSIELIEVVG